MGHSAGAHMAALLALNDAYLFYRNDVVIAAMLSIGLLGFLSDRLVIVVRDSLLAWNRKETFGGEN